MKHTKHLLVLWAALLLGAGNAWGVTSGTTYTLTSSNGVPTGWTITGDIGSSYTTLSKNAVIQTDVFCISSISSIQLNARYYGGSGNTAKITITWVDTSSSTESILGTITPTTNKETASYTLSSSSFSNTPSSNSEGYLKFEAKSATSSKYAGVKAITITFTAGTCSTPPTTPYSVQFNAGTNGTCNTPNLTEASAGAGVTLPDCTPNTGYTFVGWATTNGATTPDAGVAGDTYNPTENCTLYAVYKKQYTITWMSNNTQYGQTQKVIQGEAITMLPTPPDAPVSCSDKVFMGWTAASSVNADGTGITYITAETVPYKDEIYYAVFATKSGSGSVDTYDWETTETGNWTVDNAITRTSDQGVSGGYAGKINTANTYVTYKNKVAVTSFSFDFKRTTTNTNYNVYIETSTDNTNWTAAATYAMSSFSNGSYGTTTTHTFDGKTELYVRFHCYNTTATRYVDNVSISYGIVSYSDYITQCDDSKASVSYNFNGGDGTCTTATVNKGDNYAICTELPSRTGYTFGGWSDGTNTYGADETITNVQANITLTAQWQANTYTVTFDPNSGNGTPTMVDYTYDGTVVAMPIPTRDGFGFVGWYTEQTGGTKWEDVGNTNKPTSNITLYAHWSELYSVTFIANGQTFVTQTDKYCSGDALQLPATDPDAGTYACAGYTFVGWASDEQSTETTTCPTLVSASTPITADATFHAVWKKSDGSGSGDMFYLSETSSSIVYYIGSYNSSSNYFNAVTNISDAIPLGIEDGKYLYTYIAGIKTYISHSTSGETTLASSTTTPKAWTITDNGTTIKLQSTVQTTRYLGYSSGFRAYANSHTLTKTAATQYLYTTSPQCCPVNLQNPVVSTSVADGSVTLNWTMSADEDKVTDYTVTCVGGVTEDVTGTSYTFTGLTNCTEYTFTVRANGDGTAVCPSEIATVKATPAADSFTVTFDYGAGAGTPASWASGCGNTSVTLPEPTTLPDNHTFEGWYDGTTLYASGDTYTPTADITLTARYTKKAGVDVVEWDPNSVTVEIGVGGAAQVQIENEVTSGSGTGKVADELFFSKYFEATGNVKLVAVYNGTGHDVDVTNYTIKYGRTDWESGYIKLGNFTEVPNTMAAGEEVILYSTQSQGDDNKIMNCVSAAYPNAPWQQVTNGNSGNSGGNGLLSFAGDKTIALYDGSTLLDVIGAITPEGAPTNTGASMKKPSWGDAKGWTCDTGLSIEDGTEIGISTNRCLLVRKNTVKSGANAVAQNTADFATLCDEWLGQHVPDDPADNGVQASCDNFAYVGTYDYNGYYSTYQELTKVDLGGNQNADGTYTIPVSKLNDISCSKIRINVLDGSSSSPLVSSEYKVPIMVNASDVITTNAIFTKHKVADCSECDVVVLKGATLEKAPDGTADDRNEFRNMEVYAGGKLKVPTSATDLKVNKLVMRSKGDEVPVAEINGTLTIADKLYHAKRIDAARFYFFTLPYDCNVADITYYNGEVLAGRGIDHLIKYYDGAGRAIGQNAGHWEVYTGSLLEAGKGYIVAISASLKGSFESNPKKELLFPMTNALSEMTTKTVAVGTYGIGDASIGDNHKGWNLIGCPFMSNYSPIDAKGLKVGTYEDGTWDDGGKIFTYNPSVTIPYVTMPNTDGKTYTQKLASSQELQPFRSFFVQVGKVGDIISDVAFSSANRVSKAPRKAPAADAAVWVELTLSNASGSDATTVIVDDDKTTDYEIGADLEKMLGYAALPQFYSLKSSTRLAFNALPSASASGAVPLGFYAPASDTYTIAMNTTQAQNLEGVYLTDNVTGMVTNLLLGDYSFTSGRTLNDARFSLAVVRSVTAVDNVLLEAVTPVVHRRTLRIDNAPVGSLVRVYDTLGREVVSEQIDAETVVYQLQIPGVYHVQILSKDSKSVYKVVSY